MKEKHNFFVKLRVEKKDNGKLIDLSKQQELEIDFRGGEGQVVNQEKKGVILTFEKDGKKYQVLLKIAKVKKGWFKDEIVGAVFAPLPNENFLLYENPSFITSSR
jgi:hypothetical protein